MADYYIGLALDSGEGFGGYSRRPFRNKPAPYGGPARTPKKQHVKCQFCGATSVFWNETRSGHVLADTKTKEPHSCLTSAAGFEDCAP
ncbi:hypothetical protein [Comamonas antarctica]|uniref:hypothetical protein n=1 Tax=Comamonas antarctica TaxID=2743470 RepID=UPI0028EDC640|nr:hypothetical protein [Comamonas antarctica]